MHNEVLKMRGADTLAKMHATGAIAGGYALGKSIGSGATGLKGFENCEPDIPDKNIQLCCIYTN